jgi:hypothetical protein
MHAACLLLLFLEYYMSPYVNSGSTEDISVLHPPEFALIQLPHLRRISMVERHHIAPHALGPLDAACSDCTDHRGLGLLRRGLFASAWLGSQAFEGAAAFNANIGAWNTAKIANMASVCVLIGIACV